MFRAAPHATGFAPPLATFAGAGGDRSWTFPLLALVYPLVRAFDSGLDPRFAERDNPAWCERP